MYQNLFLIFLIGRQCWFVWTCARMASRWTKVSARKTYTNGFLPTANERKPITAKMIITTYHRCQPTKQNPNKQTHNKRNKLVMICKTAKQIFEIYESDNEKSSFATIGDHHEPWLCKKGFPDFSLDTWAELYESSRTPLDSLNASPTESASHYVKMLFICLLDTLSPEPDFNQHFRKDPHNG